MPFGTPLRAWSACFAIMVIGVVIAFVWLDRPIAFFVHANVTDKTVFIWMQRLPEIFPPLSAVVLVVAGLWALARRPIGGCLSVAMLSSLSLVVASAVNAQLKFAFGRTWPETWVNNNPSLIGNGAFGFNPFHGGPGYASFPSGHTVAICAVMAVLWLCYPRGRPIYALCVAAVVAGLLGADFHFLSDIIAGGFLGATVGWTTVALSRGAGSPRP